MIIQGLIIVIVILILANFAVGVFNRVSPPCMDANEYFAAGKKMPGGLSASLGTIPSGMPVAKQSKYSTSSTPNGYIGSPTTNSPMSEGYVNPVVAMVDEDDDSDCAERVRNETKVSGAAVDAMDKIIPGMKKKSAPVKSEPKASAESEIDDSTLSGLRARAGGNVKDSKGRHMAMAFRTARDGYTSRPCDKDD